MPFDEAMSVYITSIYFATTTMTTVGYGDISAKDNMYEQIYCMLMIFFGMALFALVQNRTMSLKNHESILAEIEANTLNMERYLAQIDRVLPNQKIAESHYDKCLTFMKASFQYSVYNVFHEKPFFT